ncbi:MAG: class I SAM-dependent methyltransferase, partial [Woeseiaceae bacterium]
LASRARRAVGIDIDGDARRFARAHLLLAGLPNCTFRHGDMYSLPLADREFDTIIVDDVLGSADDPVKVLVEAMRPLRPGGRILLLNSTSGANSTKFSRKFAEWSREAGLRLAPPRAIPATNPKWLLGVATRTDSVTEAA